MPCGGSHRGRASPHGEARPLLLVYDLVIIIIAGTECRRDRDDRDDDGDDRYPHKHGGDDDARARKILAAQIALFFGGIVRDDANRYTYRRCLQRTRTRNRGWTSRSANSAAAAADTRTAADSRSARSHNIVRWHNTARCSSTPAAPAAGPARTRCSAAVRLPANRSAPANRCSAAARSLASRSAPASHCSAAAHSPASRSAPANRCSAAALLRIGLPFGRFGRRALPVQTHIFGIFHSLLPSVFSLLLYSIEHVLSTSCAKEFSAPPHFGENAANPHRAG